MAHVYFLLLRAAFGQSDSGPGVVVVSLLLEVHYRRYCRSTHCHIPAYRILCRVDIAQLFIYFPHMHLIFVCCSSCSPTVICRPCVFVVGIAVFALDLPCFLGRILISMGISISLSPSLVSVLTESFSMLLYAFCSGIWMSLILFFRFFLFFYKKFPSISAPNL